MKVLKKFSVTLLCVILLLSSVSFLNTRINFENLQSTFVSVKLAQKKGDVNSDGYVDINDLTKLRAEVCKELFTDKNAVQSADVNQDGVIDMRDYVKLKKILGLTPSVPSDWKDPVITPPTPED